MVSKLITTISKILLYMIFKYHKMVGMELNLNPKMCSVLVTLQNAETSYKKSGVLASLGK